MKKILRYRTLQLKEIYSYFLTRIDKGAIESLAPCSAAYSNLLPTNVKSYAIAGSWKPDATMSQKVLEEYYRNILGDPSFSLDKDGFNGENDLQVSVSSQLGGLDGKCRRSVDKNPPNTEQYTRTPFMQVGTRRMITTKL